VGEARQGPQADPDKSHHQKPQERITAERISMFVSDSSLVAHHVGMSHGAFSESRCCPPYPAGRGGRLLFRSRTKAPA